MSRARLVITAGDRTADRPGHGLATNPRPNPVIMLIADHDVRVMHAITGELLRELTIDPTRDYQPLKPNEPDP